MLSSTVRNFSLLAAVLGAASISAVPWNHPHTDPHPDPHPHSHTDKSQFKCDGYLVYFDQSKCLAGARAVQKPKVSANDIDNKPMELSPTAEYPSTICIPSTSAAGYIYLDQNVGLEQQTIRFQLKPDMSETNQGRAWIQSHADDEPGKVGTTKVLPALTPITSFRFTDTPNTGNFALTGKDQSSKVLMTHTPNVAMYVTYC